MQGHAGETRFITWFAGLRCRGHDISCWYLDQSFLYSTGAAADSPGPELGITGNKGHFTPSSGMISPRSFFKQHNTNVVTNMTEIFFQDFERLLEFFFFLFQQEKPAQASVKVAPVQLDQLPCPKGLDILPANLCDFIIN